MAKYTWNGRYRPNAFTPENDRDQLLDLELLGSVRDADLADDIIAEGCEIQKETMIDLFARREKALAKRLLSGYSFVNDIVQMQPRVTGVFEDINTPFDPNVNKCVVDMTAAAALRNSLASEVGVKIIGTKEAGGAKIGAVTNTVSGAKDGTVPIGDDVIIEGEKIKILDEADAEQGVFFIDAAGTEHRVSRKLTVNKPAQIIARVPADLAEGSVTLVIRTKFSGSSAALKTVRELKYTFVLNAVK